MMAVRVHLQIEGIVQGVGFRPFVYALANSWQLNGLVGNNSLGVFVEIEGAPWAVTGFQQALRRQAPPLAFIDVVTVREVTPTGVPGFRIAASRSGDRAQTQVAPDCATCGDCLRELSDPDDRRFGYPFINCTNCGPRFTIVRGVPYDRPLTTMAGFEMCPQCRSEYDDPADRRFHAQPLCCHACGPQLRFTAPTTREPRSRNLPGNSPENGPWERDLPGKLRDLGSWSAIRATADFLRQGKIVAIKGLGGYHLAVDATSESATRTLRARKHREQKAFAVMVQDLATARRLAHLTEADERLMTSAARPIVLVPARDCTGLASQVAPNQRTLGLMLPYTPLHELLMRHFAGPLVLTSGNISDEPIAYLDDDARQRLASTADAFLVHDRPIHRRVDDSVARTFRGEAVLIRRSRGYAPRAIRLPVPAARPILGCGAELKNTFCLARGDSATMSHHIGDLLNFETWRSFTEGIEHLKRLFGIEPVLVAHDLHPDYLSTKFAVECGLEPIGVQHHHAHIASCLVDNGRPGPVIGVAFDGTGYGADNTLWGGEFLVADLATAHRAGHFSLVPMPGGEMAVRQPWRMAAAYCAAMGRRPAMADRHGRQWDAVTALARSGLNAPLTSSAGRLFDAVASLAGVRDEVAYEGQAAIELEQLADKGTDGTYRARLTGDAPFQVSGADFVAAVLADHQAGAPAISMRFHRGVALSIADGCELIRETNALQTVALSGGVFQNQLLSELAVGELERRGFEVLTHHRIPANDGGISIGQVAVAAARDSL